MRFFFPKIRIERYNYERVLQVFHKAISTIIHEFGKFFIMSKNRTPIKKCSAFDTL